MRLSPSKRDFERETSPLGRSWLSHSRLAHDFAERPVADRLVLGGGMIQKLTCGTWRSTGQSPISASGCVCMTVRYDAVDEAKAVRFLEGRSTTVWRDSG